MLRKKNKAQFNSTIWQFLKFALVGLSNTVISLLIYYGFLLIDPALYLWGNAVGWAVGVLNAFYWSNRFVFKPQQNGLRAVLARLLKTYLAYSVTFFATQVLLIIEIRCLGISDKVAPIINLFFSLPMNFVLNKLWAFQEKERNK